MASHSPQDHSSGAPETPGTHPECPQGPVPPPGLPPSAAPVEGASQELPLLPHSLGRLRPRAMTIRQLVTQRVEWRPARTCQGCRHLGPLIAVVDFRGARRLRRRCPHAQGGYTTVDWPACDRYEEGP